MPAKVKKRRWIALFALLGTVGIALIVALGLPPRESVYQGKSIQTWFEAYATHTSPGFFEASQAFQEMGRDAVPFLAAKLRTRDSIIERIYLYTWPRLPLGLRRRLPAPRSWEQDIGDAVELLKSLGPTARPAVPALVQIVRGGFRLSPVTPPLGAAASGRRPYSMSLPVGSRWLYSAARLHAEAAALRGSAAAALVACDPDNPEVFWALFDALHDSGSASAIAPAISRLNSHLAGRPLTRTQTAALLRWLKGGSPWIGGPAAETLVRASPDYMDQVVRVLVQRLADQGGLVAIKAAATLVGLSGRSDQVVAALVGALSSSGARLQLAAIQTLAEIGPTAREAVPALSRLLASTPHDARYFIAVALWKIDGRVRPLIPFCVEQLEASPAAAWWDLHEDRAALREWGWVKVAPGEEDTVQWEAARFLGGCGSRAKAAVPALIGLLHNHHDRLRAVAAEALGEIGPAARPAVPALKAALHDPWVNVRQTAAVALKLIDRHSPAKASTH
jgi:HEAT repeat protein